MSDDKKKTPDEGPKGASGKKPAKSVKPSIARARSEEKTAEKKGENSKSRQRPTVAKTPSSAKNGISRPSAVFMSLLAAIAGGAIGWGGPMIFGGQGAKNDTMQAALEQTRTDLDAAKAERDKLATTLASIQGTSRSQASSTQSISQSIAALEDELQQIRKSLPEDTNNSLTALEDRISTLGTLSVPANEDGEDGETTQLNILGLVERMDALESDGSDELISRLDAIESRLSEITSAPISFPEPETTPIDVPPEQSAQEQLNILIASFPRTKMLEAVDAQKALAARKPSWLQRALSRHIKTHDEDQADPVETIDAAQAALKSGDIDVSIKLLGDLNPPVRAIAADWIDAAKKAAPAIEKDL